MFRGAMNLFPVLGLDGCMARHGVDMEALPVPCELIRMARQGVDMEIFRVPLLRTHGAARQGVEKYRNVMNFFLVPWDGVRKTLQGQGSHCS